MVEAKFTSFQMQQKCVFGYTRELVKSAFGEALKRLDAVDVDRILHVLILAVKHAIVAVKTHTNQAVVASPTIRVDHCHEVNFAPNNAWQRSFETIGYYLGVHAPCPLERAKDNGSAARPPTALAQYTTRPEVGLVQFQGTAQLGGYRAELVQPLAQTQVDIVDRTYAQAREADRIRGHQIQGKQAQQITKFTGRDFAAPVVVISGLHNSKLCPFS